MSTKQTFILNPVSRRLAIEAVRAAPDGHAVRVSPRTRTLDQNAKMWPMLTDIAKQVQWPVDGELVWMIEEDWKDLFSAALKKHQRMARGLEGGVVMLGGHTSRMHKAEFCDLIDLMYAFGNERGVVWSEKAKQSYDQYRKAA